MNTAIFVIIIVNLFTIALLFGTTKYLNYIDKKAQKQYQRIRENIEILESYDQKSI